MYAKVSKAFLFDFLLANKFSISEKLIIKCFEGICDFERAKFVYSIKVSKKLKSTLVYLERCWRKIKRTDYEIRRKFKDKCKTQFIELHLDLFSEDHTMEVDLIPLNAEFDNHNHSIIINKLTDLKIKD